MALSVPIVRIAPSDLLHRTKSADAREYVGARFQEAKRRSNPFVVGCVGWPACRLDRALAERLSLSRPQVLPGGRGWQLTQSTTEAVRGGAVSPEVSTLRQRCLALTIRTAPASNSARGAANNSCDPAGYHVIAQERNSELCSFQKCRSRVQGVT